MDFVHVHDIARSVVMALDVPEQANVPINIGTGIDTTVAELARILIDAVGVDVEPKFNPRDVLVSAAGRRHHPGQGGARLGADHRRADGHEGTGQAEIADA